MSTATYDAAAHSAAATATMAEANETIQLVTFSLDEETYAVEITKVREIILMGEITRVPQTPPYIKGLINLRSTVIPVVDLRVRFGLAEQQSTDESRIMVVNVGAKTVGIVVDGVDEVLRVSKDQMAPAPTTVASSGNEYLTGLVKLEGRLIQFLELDKIFAAGEIDALDKVV